MAFAAFADAPVDVAVIETGMGGITDATNVADGAVAVITPISLDHVDYLGPDVETIAGEKAGIIKAGATAVLAQQELPAASVLMRRAAEMGATVAREGLEFGVLGRELAISRQLLPLKVSRKPTRRCSASPCTVPTAANAACALAAVEALTSWTPPSTPSWCGRRSWECARR